MKKLMSVSNVLINSVIQSFLKMMLAMVCVVGALSIPVTAHAQYDMGSSLSAANILTNPIYQAVLLDDDTPVKDKAKDSKVKMTTQQIQKQKLTEDKVNHNTLLFLIANVIIAGIIIFFMFFFKGRNIFSVRDGLR
jgi:hypothetical protein